MAPDFKIFFHQNNGTVPIHLSGDFDDSAACQLIHALKSNYRNGIKFLVDTCSLARIHPFGLGLSKRLRHK